MVMQSLFPSSVHFVVSLLHPRKQTVRVSLNQVANSEGQNRSSHMQKKVNTHCAQFNIYLTSLELVNDAFHVIYSAVCQ
jgi:hypothetical protein